MRKIEDEKPKPISLWKTPYFYVDGLILFGLQWRFCIYHKYGTFP